MVQKKFLAIALSTFPIRDEPGFIKGPRSLPKNPPTLDISCERIAEGLQVFETCVLAINN